MWMFAALLILAAGLFPLQALVGLGASETPGGRCFLGVFAVVTLLTVIFTRGCVWQVAVARDAHRSSALWAYHFPKIGVAFMPPLDEGTTLDMPVTVPRASVTQAADDLKARDALLRGFPEVESVIGKAGPGRHADRSRAAGHGRDVRQLPPASTVAQARAALRRRRRGRRAPCSATLESRGFVARAAEADDRDNLLNDAAQKALERFDETMRELALRRYREFETELGPRSTRFAVADTLRRCAREHRAHALAAVARRTDADADSRVGCGLTHAPLAWKQIARLQQSDRRARCVERRASCRTPADARASSRTAGRATRQRLDEPSAASRRTLAGADAARRVEDERERPVARARQARSTGSCSTAAPRRSPGTPSRNSPRAANASDCSTARRTARRPSASPRQRSNAQLGKPHDADGLRAVRRAPRRAGEAVPRTRASSGRGPAGRRAIWSTTKWAACCRCPAGATSSRSRSSTASRCSRPACAPTSASRSSAPTWTRSTASASEIEAALKPIHGARDVVAAPIMGKGYLEIDIDREQAARYGISRRGHPERDRDGPRRPRRHVHRREARALPRPRSLRPRSARGRGGGQAAADSAPADGRPTMQRRRDDRRRGMSGSATPHAAVARARCRRASGSIPLDRRRRRAHRRRPGDDQERERPAAQLRHAQRPRPRHRRLRRGGPARSSPRR